MIFQTIIAGVLAFMIRRTSKHVKSYEELVQLYQNPRARVVPQENVKDVMNVVEKKRVMKSQARQPLMSNPVYVPPQLNKDEEAKEEFNYSVCESVDYQSDAQPQVYT